MIKLLAFLIFIALSGFILQVSWNIYLITSGIFTKIDPVQNFSFLLLVFIIPFLFTMIEFLLLLCYIVFRHYRKKSEKNKICQSKNNAEQNTYYTSFVCNHEN